MFLVEVDEATCVGCGACASNCPQNVYEMLDGVSTVTEAECIGCQTCVAVCPAGAISLNTGGTVTNNMEVYGFVNQQ